MAELALQTDKLVAVLFEAFSEEHLPSQHWKALTDKPGSSFNSPFHAMMADVLANDQRGVGVHVFWNASTNVGKKKLPVSQ
ncbi:hypothetical protein KTT_50520 [Tengunoibacter tsumagoiensis]|uniref:Uncharacterized protein n=1 Tax=Tengunoibacter tsumagoiensis TaxID=2014871 RepID=A0A402A7R9_9CHLR|nr:hypothetical protein KTT_50520 [Tengunoibacter tsumagoiensis]